MFDRAAAGAKPPEARSIEEVLQLARIASEGRLEIAQHLEQELVRDPAALANKQTLARLRKSLSDPATAPLALALVAKSKGTAGPDLLYEVWTASANRTDVTELAQALLMTREVRASASPALSLALDLRAAETCYAVTSLLERVPHDGDQRASGALTKWKHKRGCGPQKNQACCTSAQVKELDAALAAVKARKGSAAPEGT